MKGLLTQAMADTVVRGPLAATLNSFEFRTRLAAERASRIQRIVAHEQLLLAATLASGTRGRQNRMRYWTGMVRTVGMAPDPTRAAELVFTNGV